MTNAWARLPGRPALSWIPQPETQAVDTDPPSHPRDGADLSGRKQPRHPYRFPCHLRTSASDERDQLDILPTDKSGGFLIAGVIHAASGFRVVDASSGRCA